MDDGSGRGEVRDELRQSNCKRPAPRAAARLVAER